MPPRDGEPLLSPRLSDKALANKNPCPALSHVRTGISERQLWQGLPHLQPLQDSEVLWRRTYGWHSSRELFIWLTRLFGEGCTRSPTSKHASDQAHLAFIPDTISLLYALDKTLTLHDLLCQQTSCSWMLGFLGEIAIVEYFGLHRVDEDCIFNLHLLGASQFFFEQQTISHLAKVWLRVSEAHFQYMVSRYLSKRQESIKPSDSSLSELYWQMLRQKLLGCTSLP